MKQEYIILLMWIKDNQQFKKLRNTKYLDIM